MEKTVHAYAKINLTLDLTARLPNGYHSLFTVMQTVSLHDTVRTSLREDGVIAVRCSDPSVPCDSRNTVYKAALSFFRKTGLTFGADIFIEKNIPHEAGLGGGSADAAAVLSALNGFFPGRLSEKELYASALETGADVPFCFAGGTRLCLNVGEVMTELPAFDSFIVIAKPDAGVSTKTAFARFDSASGLPHPDNNAFLYHAAKGEYREAFSYAGNLFETLVPLAEGEEIRQALIANGAYYAAMSGSGSAYFGLFSSEEASLAAAENLEKAGRFVCACRTVNG